MGNLSAVCSFVDRKHSSSDRCLLAITTSSRSRDHQHSCLDETFSTRAMLHALCQSCTGFSPFPLNHCSQLRYGSRSPSLPVAGASAGVRVMIFTDKELDFILW